MVHRHVVAVDEKPGPAEHLVPMRRDQRKGHRPEVIHRFMRRPDRICTARDRPNADLVLHRRIVQPERIAAIAGADGFAVVT